MNTRRPQACLGFKGDDRTLLAGARVAVTSAGRAMPLTAFTFVLTFVVAWAVVGGFVSDFVSDFARGLATGVADTAGRRVMFEAPAPVVAKAGTDTASGLADRSR